MLFLPAVIILVFVKQKWLNALAGIVIVIGLIVSFDKWPLYLLSLAMTFGILHIIKAIIKAIKSTD